MSNTDTMDTLYGAAFIALVVSAVLYGLTLLQTFNYFRTYTKDPKGLKFLVIVLWVFDTLHLILCTITLYWYLITNFNNPPILAFNHWAINIQTDCNGIIGVLVELFFAQRVWRVSGNRYLTIIITVLAFMHFGLGVYFTERSFILREFSKYNQLTWVTVTGLGSAAAADIIIAGSLVYFLGRSRTGFQQTDTLIQTLMLYAVNTGLLTSICATIAVICFAVMPSNFIWLSFFWCLGKLYVNSLLASLNSRESLRERLHLKETTVVNLSNIRSDPSSPGINRRFSHSSQIPPKLRITVETTKEQKSDYYSKTASPIEPNMAIYSPGLKTSLSNELGSEDPGFSPEVIRLPHIYPPASMSSHDNL